MQQNQKNGGHRVQRQLGVLLQRLGDRVALANPLANLRVHPLEHGVAGAVSRVMLSASRIGTPLAINVPSVRAVRATMFFSISWPKIGILMMN